MKKIMALLKSLWNVFWFQWTWPLKLAAVLGFIVLLALIFGGLRSCVRPPKPKLNQKEIIEAQQAIETRNTEKQKEVLAASDVREQQAVDNINRAEAATNRAIEAAKTKYDEWTDRQIAEELEKRANGSR